MKRIIALLLVVLCFLPVVADEGMWMLNTLTKDNRDRMQELGFLLSAEQLYDEENPSLKDAVVHFNGGCTGISVSGKGLIFTNHHCGYSAIQSQSTVDHDYLKDGFISQTFEEEIPIPGMFVRYLIASFEVSNLVLDSLDGNLSEKERQKKIDETIKALEEKFSNESYKGYEVRIAPYFAGNQYFANVYQTYRDIRLVFAPPSSLGKYGGDTDNWMWPRHTGDFSVFRVYADAENKPADYADTNLPYQPKYVAPITFDGYKEGSYAMVIGYPGRTNRYLSSWGVDQRIHSSNEPRIEVRGIKQDIWKEAMLQSDAIRIKYASKYARSSNYWKNSIGMNRGLERMKVIERKQDIEKQFNEWLNQNKEKQSLYGNALALIEEGYESTNETQKWITYLNEVRSGTEILPFALYIRRYLAPSVDEKEKTSLYEEGVLPFYKDYEPALDQKTLIALLQILKNRLPHSEIPDIFSLIDRKYKGDFSKYVADVFEKSILPYPDKLKAALFNSKKPFDFEKDPAVQLAVSLYKQTNVLMNRGKREQISQGERLFMAGLMEMNPDRNFPSDANSTMRLTYGKVGGYIPFDGAWYDYYTTQKGVLEKYKKNDPEFNIQPEILALLNKRDFGRYGNGSGNINVDFLTDNDITGGNSGSPIFDAKGRLLGLAFDGNWEAMSGDIAFETGIQRCIGVDIRYILFLIDQWGHCNRLLEELIVDTNEE
jgi:hypothetical protein